MSAEIMQKATTGLVAPCCEYCPAIGDEHAPDCRRPISAATRLKRREMQKKLDAMFVGGELKIDTAKMSDEGLARLQWGQPEKNGSPQCSSQRFDLARDILLRMIDNGGDKHDKVRAAVEYADLLIAELEGK